MSCQRDPIPQAHSRLNFNETPSPAPTKTREGSKHDLIPSLLRRKQGATLAELQKVSGWQAHSVRGFLSGTVKKRLGLNLQSDKEKDGERHYSVSAS